MIFALQKKRGHSFFYFSTFWIPLKPPQRGGVLDPSRINPQPFHAEISYTVPEFYDYIAGLVAKGCLPTEIYYDNTHNPSWVRFNQWPSAGGVAVTISTGFFSQLSYD
jgi:hypothetical protein